MNRRQILGRFAAIVAAVALPPVTKAEAAPAEHVYTQADVKRIVDVERAHGEHVGYVRGLNDAGSHRWLGGQTGLEYSAFTTDGEIAFAYHGDPRRTVYWSDAEPLTFHVNDAVRSRLTGERWCSQQECLDPFTGAGHWHEHMENKAD